MHNNLYSEKSLNFITKKYKLKIIGEWWFGTDIMDLMRTVITNSKNFNKELYEKKVFINTLYQLWMTYRL